jgi:uncharacterized protein
VSEVQTPTAMRHKDHRMIHIWLAFITGLTTGGLGCLALQGGLLVSSLAQQVEAQALGSGSEAGARAPNVSEASVAHTITLFLSAKVVSHSVLGLLLGALGAILKLNALTRAVLQLSIGVFMIGNALRMLDVHPIFRYFAFDPPPFVTRYIRRVSRRDPSSSLPLLLGALTVLIPCGVTQTMMVAAMGTGDALTGGAMLAAFILGTSPVFFAVAYFAMRIGAKLEQLFMSAVALMMLILGFVVIDSSLNLMDSPVSVNRLARALRADKSIAIERAASVSPPPAVPAPNNNPSTTTATSTTTDPTMVGISPAATETAPKTPAVQTLTVAAQHDGYVPPRIYALADVPSEVLFVTQHARSCTRALVIPSIKYETYLPETGNVTVDIPPMASGTVLRFSCAAGIYTGEIIFD